MAGVSDAVGTHRWLARDLEIVQPQMYIRKYKITTQPHRPA